MRVRRGLAAILLAAGCCTSLLAQAINATSGNIYGRVTDEQGGALPGVSVTLSGLGAPRTEITDAKGEFRFLNLPPGKYAIKSELSGLTTIERPDVEVKVGANTELTIPMNLKGVATAVTVSGETPLLDTRKDRAGSSFNQEQLQSIPSSRDPWGLLQQSAGVLVDNVIVASNNSGQQSVFIGKGTNFTNNAWNMDGVAITDLAAVGASPTYYDFDAFQEMQMTTGGADPTIVTPGVTVNMITKRGTNEIRGSARVFNTPEQTESHNTPAEAVDQGVTSNRIVQLLDYGAEVGFPVWKDKAWLWGSYGRQDLRTLTAAGTPDNTQIEDYAGKLNLQPIESNSFTAFYFRGNKTKQGRSAGPTRPPETTWNQLGPTPVEKIDDSQVFSSNVFANVSYSYSNSGFSLEPQGGLGVDVYRDAARVYHNSYYEDVNYRPQHQVQGTVTSFFNTGALGHEIKFGGADIHFQQKHTRVWPGDAVYGFENPIPSHDPNFPLTANITRNVAEGQNLHTWGVFLGDTITTSNLTAKLGVRYDQVSGHNLPANVPANPAFPDLMPGLSYAGGVSEFTSKAWQPRVGLTYSLGAEKKTLLRASYSRYADQLGVSTVAATNPVGLPQPTISYQWNDLNHDHIVQRNELCLTCPFGTTNFNPSDPNAVFSPNKIDPNFHAPKTDEFIVGVDHQVLPELLLGLSYTRRERNDLWWQCPLALDNSAACISSSDYAQFNSGEPLHDLNGNVIGMSGPLYYVPALTPGAPGYNPAIANNYSYGTFLTNRKGYKTTYDGIELQVSKRLVDKWMVNASFSYMNWKQRVSDVSKGCIDPTNQVGTGTGYFEAGLTPGLRGNSCANGDIAYDYNGTNWINAKWAFSVAGLYQLPLGFTVAGSVFGRQGYPSPRYVSDDPGDGFGNRDIAAGTAESSRLGEVFQVDISLQKIFQIAQNAEMTLSVDMFNAFNANTILFRLSGDGTVGAIQTIQNPRVFRFGARVSF
jgi:hypothetical protein